MCKATFVHHWKQSIKTQNCHCTAMTCVFQCLCNTFTYHWEHKTDPETNSQLWPVLATVAVSNRQQHCDKLQRQTNSTVTSYKDRQTALWPVTETDKQHCDQLHRQTTALWPVYRDRQQRCDQCTETDNSTVTSMQPSVTCTFCIGCTCATLWCSHLAASGPQMTYKADCNCSVTVHTSPW